MFSFIYLLSSIVSSRFYLLIFIPKVLLKNHKDTKEQLVHGEPPPPENGTSTARVQKCMSYRL